MLFLIINHGALLFMLKPAGTAIAAMHYFI